MDEKKEGKKDDLFAKSIDFVFNNKALTLIVLIFVIGTFLRFIASQSIEPNADEMVHGPHAYGIIDSGVIGRVWQSILWSYMTDFFYQLFGISMLAARSLSFIYGSLLILLVYLVALEIFNKRIALLSSLIFAVSVFSLRFTLIEMDLAAVFFVLLAGLFFIKKLKKDKKISYLAGILIGIAALIKTLALFFVPAFVIGYFYFRGKIDKEGIMQIVKFGLLITFVFSPIIIHNWLWYQDKEMVDAYLAQYFDVGSSREIYAGIQGISSGFRFTEMLRGCYEILYDLLTSDPLTTILGLFGMAFFVARREKFSVFFLAFQFFPWIFIAITNRLPTHYAVFQPIFAIYGGAFVYYVIEKYKFNFEKSFLFFAVALIVVNSYILVPYMSSQTGATAMRDFASENIGPDDIVIADSRIYRGRMMWLFIDKHYLESSYLPNILEANNRSAGVDRQYKTYFIECVVDDCGWGTVKDQPDFNATSEYFVQLFKQNSKVVATFNGGGSPTYYPPAPYFRVYETYLPLKPSIIPVIDSTHSFFYYPANYNPRDQILDNYNVTGIFNNILFVLAKLIIWISLIGALLVIPYVFYWTYKSFKINW